MLSTQTKRAPLAWLVSAQLKSIKKQELTLKSRLSAAASTDKAVAALEISALQSRMDRLNRMIDAMSPSWGTGSLA